MARKCDVVQLDFPGVNDGGTVGVEVEGTGRGSLPNTTADWGLRIIITSCSGKTNDAFKNTSGDNDYFVLPTNSSWYSLVVRFKLNQQDQWLHPLQHVCTAVRAYSIRYTVSVG